MKAKGIELQKMKIYFVAGHCLNHGVDCNIHGILDFIGPSTFCISDPNAQFGFHQYDPAEITLIKEVLGNNKEYNNLLDKEY